MINTQYTPISPTIGGGLASSRPDDRALFCFTMLRPGPNGQLQVVDVPASIAATVRA